MREIKFRAWNRDTKEMIYDLGYNKDAPKQFIWMQYTGMKDQEGIRIYEDDIIEFYNADEVNPITKPPSLVLGVVVFRSGAFYVRYNKRKFRLLWTIGEPEILGNIHQDEKVFHKLN